MISGRKRPTRPLPCPAASPRLPARSERRRRHNRRKRNGEGEHKRVPVRRERLRGQRKEGYGRYVRREDRQANRPARYAPAPSNKARRAFRALPEVERATEDSNPCEVHHENEKVNRSHFLCLSYKTIAPPATPPKPNFDGPNANAICGHLNFTRMNGGGTPRFSCSQPSNPSPSSSNRRTHRPKPFVSEAASSPVSSGPSVTS